MSDLNDFRDNCCWSRCKSASDQVWYGIGLCNKHIEELIKKWHSKKDNTVPSILSKFCKKAKIIIYKEPK